MQLIESKKRLTKHVGQDEHVLGKGHQYLLDSTNLGGCRHINLLFPQYKILEMCLSEKNITEHLRNLL